MSERRTHAAAAASGSPAFSDLWRSVSKLCRNKTQDNNTGKQACDTPTPAPVMCKGEDADRSIKTRNDLLLGRNIKPD